MNMLSPPKDIKAGQSTLLSSSLTVLTRGCFMLWLRVSPWAGPLLLVAVFAAIAAYSWVKPIYNWDLVAYLAAALRNNFTSFDDTHRQLFSILKVGLPEASYQSLTVGDAYRSYQFENPAALQSMLGMYDVKWLFIKLVTLLGPTLGWLNAFVAVNFGAMALLFFSLWGWMSRFKLMAMMPLVVALFMALGMVDAFRVSLPDFLAIALMTSGVLLLDRGRMTASLAPLALAVLTRPDNAAAMCLIGFFLIAMYDTRWRHGLAMIALAVLAYFCAKLSSTSPGWWAHLWFSTYDMQNTMEGFAPAFSITVYLHAVAYNIARAMTENVWLGFYIAAFSATVWIIADSRSDERIRDPRMIIILALLIAVPAKFVLFPLHDTRTYLPVLFPLLLLIGAQLSTIVNTGWSAGKPSTSIL